MLATFISWNELTDKADLIVAKHLLFMMDACYGGLALTGSLSPAEYEIFKRYAAKIYKTSYYGW